jgi:two-component system sensor histidine kinase HupT/HoxJ
MKRYAERLRRYLDAVHAGMPRDQLEALRAELRIDRLLDDLPSLLDGTVEGAERTRDIVDALKRFSATDRDERRRFDLVEVIERAVHWVRKASAEGFEVKLALPETLPVDGTPGQLQQVVMNLVQNAADATLANPPARGRKLEVVGEVLAGPPPAIRLRFHDNGTGIAEDDLHKLFDPFFTTKPVGQGTGLGLAISYGIVERHGGKLTAANHSRGGAEFCVELPLSEG